MKKLALLFTLIALPAHAADRYEIDSAHTDIVWKASHMGFSKSIGEFADSKGYIELDKDNPDKSKVDVTIDIDSIVSGVEKLDEHLKGPDFFDAEKYPEAHFVSDTVEITGEKTARVYGFFTLRGISKPLVLDVTLNKMGENPMNKQRTVGFSATGTIDRSAYGMDYAIELVPAEVEIEIETEATMGAGLAKKKE